MRPLTVVTGMLLETQRYINVPMRFGERYVARERREIWLREADGQERKWMIHTRVCPARRGHSVVLLVRGDWVGGLFNASTGAAVNYPRTDPPFLLRGFDLFAVMALAIGLLVWLRATGFALLAPAVIMYLILGIFGRAFWRWRQRRQVDKALAEIQQAGEMRLKGWRDR
jgi:hypothetical protein